MKKTLLLLALSSFMLSCSSDDGGSENNTSTGDFLPMEAGNYWVYETETPSQNGRDSLYTDNDTVIAGNTYTKFRTEALASGFYSGSMANNSVRKSGDKLLMTGTASLNFSQELPFSIAVQDFVIFKENADTNEVIGSLEGNMQELIEGFTIDFDYGMKSRAKQDLETYTVNGQTYTDVKVIETTLNLKISTTVEGFNFAIMPAQDVLVSTQYYAKEIGVVHVITNIDYTLADLSFFDVELPIPESGSEVQEEVLVNYHVN